MGNDGGVIAVKRKFMRHGNTKARGEKVDQEALRVQRTQTCALSEEPLREPIVACALGNLYNKQAVLEHLLAKALPARFQHISSLKDVVTCHFSKQSDSSLSFYCPVTMLEFNGKQPFVVVPSCGCVLSERSLKEVQTTECLVCGKSTDNAAPIALVPLLDDAEYERRQQEILTRKAQEKQRKKEKRKKPSASTTADSTDTAPQEKKSSKKRKTETPAAASLPSSKIAQDAASAIEKEKAKSAVFASLFAKDKSSDKKSANDLLMTVGGLRYTLS